jgi:preprotein translocase subunit SecB
MTAANQSSATDNQEFAIQRIYVKGLSFESPNTPEMFRQQWEPEVKIELHTESTTLAENVYEVSLQATVTASVKEKTGFLIEVTQAGIFTIAQFTDDQLKMMLGSYCPNILFPYVREVISDVINRASFPPFILAPINFDALYNRQLQEQTAKNDEPVGIAG